MPVAASCSAGHRAETKRTISSGGVLKRHEALARPRLEAIFRNRLTPAARCVTSPSAVFQQSRSLPSKVWHVRRDRCAAVPHDRFHQWRKRPLRAHFLTGADPANLVSSADVCATRRTHPRRCRSRPRRRTGCRPRRTSPSRRRSHFGSSARSRRPCLVGRAPEAPVPQPWEQEWPALKLRRCTPTRRPRPNKQLGGHTRGHARCGLISRPRVAPVGTPARRRCARRPPVEGAAPERSASSGRDLQEPRDSGRAMRGLGGSHRSGIVAAWDEDRPRSR